MIKLIKFNGDWLITKIEEIPEVEFGDPDCVLGCPYQIEGTCFGAYPPYSDHREVIVRSSEITLIAEPKSNLLKTYLELIDQKS